MKSLPTGSYHVPVASIFCMEVIPLICSDFTDIDGMDFTKICVLDPFRNRLSIQVVIYLYPRLFLIKDVGLQITMSSFKKIILR